MDENFFLSFDIDWAPDFAIEEIASVLIENKIKATWFVTHKSPAIERLRRHPELFELGIHPNFFPGSTHGRTEDEVMTHMLEIVPEAVSMRSHGLYQNSNLLMRAAQKYGIKVDTSLFLPYMPGIQSHDLHCVDSTTLLRIPIFWIDAYEFFKPEPSWDLIDQRYKHRGLKVFDFHPIHIVLNSSCQQTYEDLKSKISYSKCAPEDILQYRNSGKGVASSFYQLLEKLSGESWQIKDLLPG